MKVPVVCIDGPNASGKGTVSRLLARRLGWHRLDSGALYRLVGLAAARRAVGWDDAPRLASLCAELDVRFAGERVMLEGEDVTRELGTEEAGERASRIAVLAPVRAALLDRQRAFRRPPGLVADGRDMGTFVFSDAACKVFLTASPEVRARRRYKQLREQGIDVSLASLCEAIRERDRRDRERVTAPLRPATDAVRIDTSRATVDEVLACVLEHILVTEPSVPPALACKRASRDPRREDSEEI